MARYAASRYWYASVSASGFWPSKALIRAYAEELAETIGRKHGFRYGEEFNYNGGGNPIPEHLREHAKPIP